MLRRLYARVLSLAYSTFALLVASVSLVFFSYLVAFHFGVVFQLLDNLPAWAVQIIAVPLAFVILGTIFIGVTTLVAYGVQVLGSFVFRKWRPKSRVPFAGVLGIVILLLLSLVTIVFAFVTGTGIGVLIRGFGWVGHLEFKMLDLAVSVALLVLAAVLYYPLVRLYRLLAVVGNLARDVIHYLAVDRNGEPKPHQQRLQSELWHVIHRFHRKSPHASIVLVTHSLGTVIATDLLLNRRSIDLHLPDLPIHLVTAGSPLRRLVLRLMPYRVEEPLKIRSSLRAADGVRIERWFNCFRRFDFVGQALSDAPRRNPKDSAWGNAEDSILERPLQHRRRLPTGHSNYWEDQRFVDFIAAEVVRPLLISGGRTLPQNQQAPGSGPIN